MEIKELEVNQLKEADWNANHMVDVMKTHLKESIRQFGLVENLVVRPVADGIFEVLSGNQRLKILKELSVARVPCLIVDLDDAHARLMAEALNHIRGQDNLGLRAEVVRKVLETISQDEVLAVLPETTESLSTLSSLGQETIVDYLMDWQQNRSARLRHMQFELTGEECSLVEEALKVAMRCSRQRNKNPNMRGQALVVICETYLKSKHLYTVYRERRS
jgi:ParB family transcriptional regulator, chromosome partitioning protein